MRDIGKNIRTARSRKKMTQDELAEKLYVTRQTVSNYETGRSRPDVECLLQISEILGVEIQELLYGPEETPERKQAKKRLIVACNILAVSSVLSVLAYALFREWASTYYTVMPMFGIRGFAIPLLLGLLGWTLLQACGVYLGAKAPQCKAVKWIRLAVLIGISVCAVLLLPIFCKTSVYAVQQIAAVCTDTRFSKSVSLDFLPVWDTIATKLFFFFYRYPYVAALIGAVQWLVGVPKEKTIDRRS